MKLIAKFKELGWIIAGGITGAVVLIGVGVVLFLLISGIGVTIPYFGIGYLTEKWTNKWFLEGIYTAFVAMGCVGVIIGGLIAKWRPQIIQKWFTATIIWGIPMIFCLWLLYDVARHIEIPRKLKLSDCTNSTTKIHLKTPKGNYYRLVLAIPSDSTNTFTGHVYVFEREFSVTNFSIGSDKTAELCNYLRSQKDYDLEIAFNQSPPPSTSIWLHWAQAYKDRDK
jgi:hypothetical protein